MLTRGFLLRTGLSRAVEGRGQKCVDGLDDQVFGCRSESGGVSVEDHGEIGLVAAFAQNPPRWDVARDVVAVGDDPEAALVDLPLEPQGIVDDHFAGEEDHGQIVAEAPGFDRVRDMRFRAIRRDRGARSGSWRESPRIRRAWLAVRGWRGPEVVPAAARACEAGRRSWRGAE